MSQGQTVSLQTAVNVMLANYVKGEVAAAATIAEQILQAAPGSEHARYIRALCRYRGGATAEAEAEMAQLEQQGQGFAEFGFRYPLAEWQGRGGWLAERHARLEQLLRLATTDALVISYPKSGRTWLRLMLGVYLFGEPSANAMELFEMTSRRKDWPTVDISHDDYPMWKPSDRIVTDKSCYKDKRVLLLVREPKDTLVSFYFQYTRRGDKDRANDSAFSGSISEFIRHDIGGLPSLVRFMNAWADQRQLPGGFMLCRYEDLHAQPVESLKRVLEFLGWSSVEDEAVRHAVEACEFSRMRKMEESRALGNQRLMPPEDGDPEGFKVRKGQVGGYREYLSDEDIAWADAYLDEHLSDFYAFYKR